MDMVEKQGQLVRAAYPLPQGSVAARAADWLAARAPEVYLVGGTIRDWLLGRESHDVDFAVAKHSLSLARRLADHLGGYFVPLDRKRGIARVVCGEGRESIYLDLTLLQGQSLHQDLSHRDFTVNAIALRLGEERPRLIDLHYGQKDAQRRLIRAVTPHIFTDDPLRLLRAVRLAAELEFAIEPQTEALLRQHVSLIGLSAAERIRYELVRVLHSPQARRWVHFLVDTGLLGSVLPRLEPYLDAAESAFDRMHQLTTALRDGQLGPLGLQALAPFGEDLVAHLAQPTKGEHSREDLLRIAALLSPLPADDAECALLRLRFSAHEVRFGSGIVAHHPRALQLQGVDISRRATYRFFHESGDAGLEALLLALALLGEGRRSGHLAEGAARMLDAYFHSYEDVVAPPPLLDGHTVMSELGLEPGPRVGQILAALREAQAAGEIRTRAEAVRFVRKPLSRC
jgi:tRNA nucleotidyltransferase (CCA-adding enzyme)